VKHGNRILLDIPALTGEEVDVLIAALPMFYIAATTNTIVAPEFNEIVRDQIRKCAMMHAAANAHSTDAFGTNLR
jgi:hypothetical protein